jgi:ornithine carbamoyltransferase
VCTLYLAPAARYAPQMTHAPKPPRHFINLPDVDPGVLRGIVRRARDLKRLKFSPPQLLSGLTLAMLFDKRSTRTRVSFEVAMKQLGGHTIALSKEESQLGGAESLEATAQVLSRYVDAVMVRMSDHAALSELARHASVPVINAMTDRSHPCQIMASVMTMEERCGRVEGLKVAWFGDFNNVASTYVEAAPLFGYDLVLALPEDLHDRVPPGVHVTVDAGEAAAGADVLVTDTWVSMGQEGKDIAKFWPFQVNAALMARAAPGAMFTHCLPMHEWEEVSEEVAKSPASAIYDEAENRAHVQKAILAWCLEEAGVSVGQRKVDF